jgi:magnesium-transporting ATPase (P-type)
LLLVHGRLAYQNNAEAILFFLYKNLVMTVPGYLFSFYAAFSGATLYYDSYVTSYNAILTC